MQISDVGMLTLKRGEKDKIQTEVLLPDDVEAPVEENQVIGKIVLKIDDNEICSYKLKAENGIEKINFGFIVQTFIKSVTKSA